jgi:hypothetical protein
MKRYQVRDLRESHLQMSFSDYRLRVTKAWQARPERRYGQTAFNVLYVLRPDLAEEVRGTSLDPFHMGDVGTLDFMTWVNKHWDCHCKGRHS